MAFFFGIVEIIVTLVNKTNNLEPLSRNTRRMKVAVRQLNFVMTQAGWPAPGWTNLSEAKVKAVMKKEIYKHLSRLGHIKLG